MKKKILFVYYEMMVGGSTTSLISLLHNLDYEKYDVDLLLYRNRGPFIKFIPKKVNILPQALIDMPNWKKGIMAVLNGNMYRMYRDGLKYYHKFMKSEQRAAYMQTCFCRKIEKEYDVAIGFLELWPDVFVNKCIKAKKKISWIHVDFEKAHYIPQLDNGTFDESDYVVTVSDECMKDFKAAFPQYADKTIMIENLLSKSFVIDRMNKAQDIEISLNESSLKLLSVCRITIDTKGLDRALKAISFLVHSGKDIVWYIVGDGEDKEKFIELIKQANMEQYVKLLGMMECPFKLYSKFDAFLLPSRFEGKPMSITEAQILGLPPIVTRYASASEQIQDMQTGFIADNDTDSLCQKLEYIYTNKNLLENVRSNLRQTNFDNLHSIKEFDKIVYDE